MFARITDPAGMTDWIPLLKTVQVSHPKPLPPAQSMAGTARMLAFRRQREHPGGGRLLDPPRCYAYTAEGKHY